MTSSSSSSPTAGSSGVTVVGRGQQQQQRRRRHHVSWIMLLFVGVAFIVMRLLLNSGSMLWDYNRKMSVISSSAFSSSLWHRDDFDSSSVPQQVQVHYENDGTVTNKTDVLPGRTTTAAATATETAATSKSTIATTASSSSSTTTKAVDTQCSQIQYNASLDYYPQEHALLPKELKEANYVRGMYPIVLNVTTKKICLLPPPKNNQRHNSSNNDEDTSSSSSFYDYYPSDGINPSIVSVHRLTTYNKNTSNESNNDNNNDNLRTQLLQRGIQYLSIVGMQFGARCPNINEPKTTTAEGKNDGTNNHSNGTEQSSSSKSLTSKPLNRATLLLGLDADLNTLVQTIVWVKLDTNRWGTNQVVRRKQKQDMNNNNNSSNNMPPWHQDYLGDARIFIHQGKLMMNFHSFQRFGTKNHPVNELHIQLTSSSNNDKKSTMEFEAYILASQTQLLCCGKNIAMLAGPPPLPESMTAARTTTTDRTTRTAQTNDTSILRAPTKSNTTATLTDSVLLGLEWIDPIKVVSLEHKSSDFVKDRKNRRSTIHGTNGHMIPISFHQATTTPTTKNDRDETTTTTTTMITELLGIGHFHRETQSQPTNAHYTHVWFTMSSVPPYQLKRLSNEFVISNQGRIPEIIQFACGMEYVTPNQQNHEPHTNTNHEQENDETRQLIITYGINDCEGASFRIPLQQIKEMLFPVANGQNVHDLLQQVVVSVAE